MAGKGIEARMLSLWRLELAHLGMWPAGSASGRERGRLPLKHMCTSGLCGGGLHLLLFAVKASLPASLWWCLLGEGQ